jgi:DNA-directed RNA polymerase subunit RPC12/RpoP
MGRGPRDGGEGKMKKSFDVLYYSNPRGEGKKFSHKYSETWEPEDIFCPRCGHKKVWVNTDGGDYYVGEQYLCTNCNSTFHLPSGVNISNSEQDKQRVAKLLEWREG